MAIKYCSECGKKYEYKFSPPKFCSECGSPMGIANQEARPIDRQVQRPPQEVEKFTSVSEDETDADHVPQIGRLQYEVEDYGQTFQQTIGSLGGKTPPNRFKKKTRDINDL